MKSPRHICSPIQVLSPRIDKMDHVSFDLEIVNLRGSVMNYRSVGPSCRYCFEAQSLVEILLQSLAVYHLSSLVLSYFGHSRSFAPEQSHGHPVSDVRVPEPFSLLLRSYCSLQPYSLPINRVFQLVMNVIVGIFC